MKGRNERATAAQGCKMSRAYHRGLAVEGPGFLVWDEVASDARKRAAELLAVAATARSHQRGPLRPDI